MDTFDFLLLSGCTVWSLAWFFEIDVLMREQIAGYFRRRELSLQIRRAELILEMERFKRSVISPDSTLVATRVDSEEV